MKFDGKYAHFPNLLILTNGKHIVYHRVAVNEMVRK